MERGQSSAELLVLLSVSLVALIGIFSLGQQSILELNNQNTIQTAQKSVNELKSAVNDVYSQGVGARKKILFIVPNGVDETASGIQGKTIYLNILGSDVYSTTNVQLSGVIPLTPGGHELIVTAHENYVSIGSQNIFVDKTSGFVSILQGNSIDENITITNSGNETVNIAITKIWQNIDATLVLSTQSFSINPSAQQTISLSYSSGSNAVGNYIGSLFIQADFPTLNDENISFPLNAEVIAPETGSIGLIILPLNYSATLNAGAIDNSSFQICNNSINSLNNIAFSDSGTIADWINPISNIGSVASGTCQTVNFTINVPGIQSSGNYTGSITAIDESGIGSNTDSIEITLNIIETPIYIPTLGNVDVALFSNNSYTTHSQSFMQNSTVYYQIRTFDSNGSIIDVSDLNIVVRDSVNAIQQNLGGLSTSSGIYNGNYTLALSALTGTWSVQADANRNSTISDSNNFNVTTFLECPTQAACFSQSWNLALMTCLTSGNNANRYCQLAQTTPFWTIQNTSTGSTLTITRIMVSWTGDTDGDTAVDVIRINNVQRNTASSASGAWNNITDFSLTPGQSFTANNWLRWQGKAAAGRMNNETETYTITFEFSDSSVYTTTGYNPP